MVANSKSQRDGRTVNTPTQDGDWLAAKNSENDIEDIEIKDNVDELIWRYYSWSFTKAQQTLFKKALADKHPDFNIRDVGSFVERDRMQNHYQRKGNATSDYYPYKFSIFKVKTSDDRVRCQIVVPLKATRK